MSVVRGTYFETATAKAAILHVGLGPVDLLRHVERVW
jgi:hypothetical protein